MRELFSNIISLQLGASIAIVLLLLSRRLMKKRYVAKLRYWLWLMVALRLCLPIDVNIQLNRRAPVNIPMQDYYVSAYTEGNLRITDFEIITIEELQQQTVQQVQLADDDTQMQPVRTLQLTDIFYRFWLAVSSGLLLVSFLSYCLAKREVLSTAEYGGELNLYLNSLKTEMAIKSDVRLAICRYTGGPMLIGIFRPVIAIPDVNYTTAQLNMILRHELTHLRRKDIAYKFLLHFVKCVYWFNPLMWLMAKYAGQDIEFSCDEDTVKNTDKAFRAEYAGTIIKVITRQDNRLVLATSFSQSAQTVKERFSNIFFGRKLKKGKSILAAFMAVVILATSMVGCTSATTSEFNINNKSQHTEISMPVDIGGKLENSYLLTINEKQLVSDKFYLDYVKSNGTKYGVKFTVSIDANGNFEYLCNKSGCSHTDASCNAYREEYNFYFTYNGNVYAVARKADISTTPYRETFQLYRITADGAELISSMPEYYLNELEMIVHEDNLYFQARDWETNTYRIMKMNLNSGEYEVMRNMPEGIHASLLLAMTDKGYIVFDGSYSNELGVYAVNMNYGDIVKIADSIMNQRAKFDDDTIYRIDKLTNIFTSQKLGEAAVELMNMSDYTAEKVNSIYKIYDDNVVIVFEDGTQIVYDTTAGQVSNKKLIRMSNGNFCEVEADLGDMYLIKSKTSGMNAELSLISKDDYFTGNAKIYPVVTCEYGY